MSKKRKNREGKKWNSNGECLCVPPEHNSEKRLPLRSLLVGKGNIFSYQRNWMFHNNQLALIFPSPLGQGDEWLTRVVTFLHKNRLIFGHSLGSRCLFPVETLVGTSARALLKEASFRWSDVASRDLADVTVQYVRKMCGQHLEFSRTAGWIATECVNTSALSPFNIWAKRYGLHPY